MIPDADLSRPLDTKDGAASFTGRMVILNADANVRISEDRTNSYVMTIQGGQVTAKAAWLNTVNAEARDGKLYLNILDNSYTLHITGSGRTDIRIQEAKNGSVSRQVTFLSVPLSSDKTLLTINCGSVGQAYKLIQNGVAIEPDEDTSAVKLSFRDVPSGAYYAGTVQWAVSNGITSGTTASTFSPNAACTRAQAVTFLWRAAGSPAPKSRVMPFADVSSGAYYRDAVLWAVENGITNGTSDTAFSPNATCSRAQIVTFLWRADDLSPKLTGSVGFQDVGVRDYFWFPVKWALENGITSGTTASTFSPNATCTRAQIVTFLYRAYA